MKVITITLTCLLGVAIASFSAATQNAMQNKAAPTGPVSGAISPVPLWPSNGVIPPELEKHYVFLDPAKGEVVLSYPENLGNLEGAPLSSVRKVFRYQRWNRVRPRVEFTVAALGDGRIEYTYTVSNESGAKGPIWSLQLVAPSLRTVESIQKPKGWLGYSQSSSISAVQIVIEKASRDDGFVAWHLESSKDPGELGIEPGQSRSGFNLTSRRLPGFSTMYVQGSGSMSLPEDLPEEVSEQFLPFMRLENDSQQALVIGPKFLSSASKREIAVDFHIGFQKLTLQGALKSDSPFVAATFAALKHYIDAAGVSLEAEAGEPPVPDELLHTPSPVPGLESTVAQALKVALQSPRARER